MAGSRIVDINRSSGGKKNVTSVTRSQRSNCNVVIYRWDDTDITKLNGLEAKSEKGYAGRGQASTSGNFGQKTRVVIRNDVIRANITKNKSSNSGTFSITLKRGKQVINQQVQNEDIDYLQVIHPGDWIMIYIKKSGEIDVNSTKSSSGFKMLGVIQNVRYLETDDPETGKPRLEYLVTGVDFGSVFDSNIFFNPVLNQDAAKTLLGAQFLVDSLKSVKGSERADPASGTDGLSADNLIKKLIGFYLGDRGTNLDDLSSTNQPWFVPPFLAKTFGVQVRAKQRGASFVDILNTDRVGLHRYSPNGTFQGASQLPGGTFIKSLPSSGSVWQVMSSLQNAISNEMYTELVPDSRGNLRPSVVMRQMPFSNKRGQTAPFNVAKDYGITIPEVPKSAQKTYFTDLPRHKIVSSDIREKNVGKSEHERINHVVVVPGLDVNSIDIGFQAVVNTPSIQRHGLRTYQGQTRYIADRKLGGFKTACKFFTHLLVDWFFLSHHYFNGTIIIDGRDEHIQLGNNLLIEDIGQLYHIEGYTHTYINQQGGSTEFTTELTVSRGQAFANNTARFIGASRSQREATTISTSTLEGVR